MSHFDSFAVDHVYGRRHTARPSPGEWDPVFARMAEALSNYFESSWTEDGPVAP
jgi:hypothetical protein